MRISTRCTWAPFSRWLSLLPGIAMVGAAWVFATPVARAQASRAKADCEQLRGATVADALQGKIPGVNVTVVGGAATGGGSIRVRGINTLESSDPLIYVDNIRISPYRSTGPRGMHSVPLFDFVDVTQIDRIEVLRGPTATLRYGDRAANGVILIHTKRGKREPGVECQG